MLGVVMAVAAVLPPLSMAASEPILQKNQPAVSEQASAPAALYEKAQKAAARGDAKTAAKLFLKAAKQGYAPAQYELALCYERCYGVPNNITKARKWLEKAAEQKYGPAEFKIGWHYVYEADQRCRRWCIKAAEHGSVEATRMVGYWYVVGHQCSKNPSRGVEYLSKAAEQGDAFACASLSQIYERGEMGVPADAAKAKKYRDMEEREKAREVEEYRKAAEGGDVRALYELASCYKRGLLGVSADEGKARELLQKAAEKGYAKAQVDFASDYCREDAAKAVEWWTKAAEQGHVGGLCSLEHCYREGRGVPQDAAKAEEYLKQAAELGAEYAIKSLGEACRERKDMAGAVKWLSKVAKEDGYSAYHLGLCYREGNEEVPKNTAKAIEYFKMGADLNSALAQIDLAKMYLAGDEVAKDEAKAVELLTKAIKRRFPEAEYELGCCYRDGKGVGKDIARARELFDEAAKQGHEQAKAALEQLGQ